MSIIIGLGTGRSGTVSLARLINAQDESVCFHEINPRSMSWSESPGTVLSMLQEFRNILAGGDRDKLTIDITSPNRDSPMQRLLELEKITTIGEVGFYYLSYVELIIKEYSDVRFPCLRRDKDETISSYVKKMRSKDHGQEDASLEDQAKYRNHWVEHSGEQWASDSKWDKCYPKFDAASLEDALSMYWDSYYEKTEKLSKIYKQVKIFELDDMNSSEGQEDILRFCGYSKPVLMNIHENRIL